MNQPQLKAFQLRDDGVFPNNPRWPLLIYPAAVKLSAEDPAADVEGAFHENGWNGTWRNGIYAYQHYHSKTHEVLGVFRGRAHVQFGGPQGVEIELKPGDVVVLPAGTAHRKIECSADFGVVGAYPSDSEYEMCRGRTEERERSIADIKQVSKPTADPVFGKQGGLCELWPD